MGQNQFSGTLKFFACADMLWPQKIGPVWCALSIGLSYCLGSLLNNKVSGFVLCANFEGLLLSMRCIRKI